MSRLRVPITPRDHVLGDKNAPMTLVEYGDFECPYCGRAYPILKDLVEEHGPRQLRFVYRHFPLAQMHPHAESAAETSEFAGAHGKFWEMHDGLYENQDQLGIELYFALAQDLGLSTSGLRRALANGDFADKVRSDFMSGVRSGVNGTPTLFLNGERYDWPVDMLAEAVRYELARAA